jgi:hypothetical protein
LVCVLGHLTLVEWVAVRLTGSVGARRFVDPRRATQARNWRACNLSRSTLPPKSASSGSINGHSLAPVNACQLMLPQPWSTLRRLTIPRLLCVSCACTAEFLDYIPRHATRYLVRHSTRALDQVRDQARDPAHSDRLSAVDPTRAQTSRTPGIEPASQGTLGTDRATTWRSIVYQRAHPALATRTLPRLAASWQVC